MVRDAVSLGHVHTFTTNQEVFTIKISVMCSDDNLNTRRFPFMPKKLDVNHQLQKFSDRN